MVIPAAVPSPVQRPNHIFSLCVGALDSGNRGGLEGCFGGVTDGVCGFALAPRQRGRRATEDKRRDNIRKKKISFWSSGMETYRTWLKEVHGCNEAKAHRAGLKQLPVQVLPQTDDFEENLEVSATYGRGYLARRPLRLTGGPAIFTWAHDRPAPHGPGTPWNTFRFAGQAQTLFSAATKSRLVREEYVRCPNALNLGTQQLDAVIVSDEEAPALQSNGSPMACTEFEQQFTRDAAYRALYDDDCKQSRGLRRDEPFAHVPVYRITSPRDDEGHVRLKCEVTSLSDLSPSMSASMRTTGYHVRFDVAMRRLATGHLEPAPSIHLRER
jgi:hypothetical protein